MSSAAVHHGCWGAAGLPDAFGLGSWWFPVCQQCWGPGLPPRIGYLASALWGGCQQTFLVVIETSWVL